MWLSVPVPTHPSECFLPNWHAPHTLLISYSLNVRSLMTTPCDCIPLSFWRLMWPILLCHSSMLVSTFRPFANMANFTSFDLRINIRPRVMSRPSFSMNQPPWLNHNCMPCSTIWPTIACLAQQFGRPRPNSSLWWVHAIRFLCKLVHLLYGTGYCRHVEWGE